MKKALIALVRGYQAISRPLAAQGLFLTSWSGCRHWPTCSEYAVQSLEQYGAVKGSWYAIVRVLRCNPFIRPQ